MSLINLNFDLSRVATALERIAICLERAYPLPIIRDYDAKPRDKSSLITYGDTKKRWMREQAQEIAKGQGLSPEMEEESIVSLLEEAEDRPNQG